MKFMKYLCAVATIVFGMSLISVYAQWGVPHNPYYPLIWKSLKNDKPIFDNLALELQEYPDKTCYIIFTGNEKKILKIKKIVLRYLTVDKKIDRKKIKIAVTKNSSKNGVIDYEIWFFTLEQTKTFLEQNQLVFSTLTIFPRKIRNAIRTCG